MKIKIEKKALVSLLSKVQNIVERRNTMPVLINILLEAKENQVVGFATNLEVSITDKVDCEVQTQGKVAVNAKSFYEILKELPEGTVHLEKQDNNWLKIKQNKSVYNIVGISPEEYPIFPAVTSQEFLKINAKVLSEMIEKTIYSVSMDETRYHLNGVYFENGGEGKLKTLRMVATDGHRLSLVDRELTEKMSSLSSNGVIIPRKGLNEMRKLLENVDDDFLMAIEGAQLIVKHKETVLMIRLIEGKYPNYRQLIPQNLSEQVKIPREALLASLKRVSLLSNQKSRGVTLSLSQGRLEISSNNPDLGDAKEEMEIDYKGKDMKIGFNAKYILDVLNSMSEDQISLELKDQLSPGLVRPKSDSSYTCVIMPMRI